MQIFTRSFVFLIIINTLFIFSSSAQVVISSTSTTPTEDGSAILELQSPDMGLLIPKFSIDDLNLATPVVNPAEGLLIYNTSSLTEPGFYFWDGSMWREVINDQRVFANEQFGELYEIAPAGTPTEVSLSSSTQWYGWTTAKPGILAPGITMDSLNTYAFKMNISKYGLYKIQLSMSIGGTQNQQITSSVWIVDNNVSPPDSTETRIKVLSKISSAGDLISGSSIGVLELDPNQSLDLRFQSTNNGEILKIYSINLIATKIGE